MAALDKKKIIKKLKTFKTTIYNYILYLYITKTGIYGAIFLTLILGLKFSFFIPLVYANEVPIINGLLKAKQIAYKELLVNLPSSTSVDADTFTSFIKCLKHNLTVSKPVNLETIYPQKIVLKDLDWIYEKRAAHDKHLHEIFLTDLNNINELNKCFQLLNSTENSLPVLTSENPENSSTKSVIFKSSNFTVAERLENDKRLHEIFLTRFHKSNLNSINSLENSLSALTSETPKIPCPQNIVLNDLNWTDEEREANDKRVREIFATYFYKPKVNDIDTSIINQSINNTDTPANAEINKPVYQANGLEAYTGKKVNKDLPEWKDFIPWLLENMADEYLKEENWHVRAIVLTAAAYFAAEAFDYYVLSPWGLGKDD